MTIQMVVRFLFNTNSYLTERFLFCFCFYFLFGVCSVSAGTIPNGGTLSGVISADGEVDVHDFAGTAGEVAHISVSGVISTGEFIQVFRPDGVLLSSGGAVLVLQLPQSGRYEVRVRSFQQTGTGSYLLHLAKSGANENGSLSNGGASASSIEVDADIDSITFQGNAGQRGVISISGNVVGGQYFYVLNPDGTRLTEGGAATRINLLQTGTYTVITRSFQASGTGNYQLYLALSPGANEHGLIPNGGSVDESISANGEIDSFTFEGDAGQRGVISISGNVVGGDYYYVFNPDGSSLTEAGGAARINLAQTGTYTVIVRSFQGAGTGSYSLYLALSPGANEHGLIANGDSVDESISADGEIDSFTFEGTAGQRGVISISGNVVGGDYYYVFNPDGSSLTEAGGAARINLAQTGTYTVIVRSFQGAGTGSYSLYLALSPGANEHGVIQNGGSVDESISADGEIDSFTFEGTAGQRGVISISGNVVGGDYYYVFNPDGSSLTEAGGAARINLVQTGTYTVIVRSFQGAGTGSYSLYLALSPGANEHGVIQNGGSVDESISADGEIDSFTFEGTAGQRGVISISGNVVGGDYYYVFNPDGSSLTEAGGAARINWVQILLDQQ